MENLVYNDRSANRLINVFFRVLLVLLVTIVCVVAFLSINETVKIVDGEVLSTVPQTKITAPFDAELGSVFVREGQVVHQGDTLFTFNNRDVLSEYNATDNDILVIRQKLQIAMALLRDLRKRRDYLLNVNNDASPKNEEEVRYSPFTIDDLNGQIYKVSQDSVDYGYQIQKKKNSLSSLSEATRNFVVTAPVSGTISYIFNSKQTARQLQSGDLLAVVSPHDESFFARIKLSEKDLIYVKKGQQVIMKLDAYYYYKYGSIKGIVDYISPSDVNKNFFALVKFEKYNPKIHLRSGYTVKGEIIIDRLKIYEYGIKKLLNKIDLG